MCENSISMEDAIYEVRKACRQFAMLYFHFSNVLIEELGEEKARPLIQKAIFELALDRSGQLREKAADAGLAYTMENFMRLSDLPLIGWVKELGIYHCPYAETWMRYFGEYPWFRQIAPLYCDVIDTTNAESFTRCQSHRITQNVMTGGSSCEREYFDSQQVSEGVFSYGEQHKKTQT